MTPEQIAALFTATRGDLILITNPVRVNNVGTPSLRARGHQLVLVDTVLRGQHAVITSLIVHPLRHFTPQDWLAWCRRGIWYFQSSARTQPQTPLDPLLTPISTILLRPSESDLMRLLLGGECAYTHCEQGLVPITFTTREHLRAFIDCVAYRPMEGMRTVCPYCMGRGLFEAYERFVQRYNEVGLTADDEEPRGEHLRRLRRRRAELGYGALAETTGLGDLRVAGTAQGGRGEAGSSRRSATRTTAASTGQTSSPPVQLQPPEPCTYTACENGLVPLNPITIPHLTATFARPTPRAHPGARTICPYCMGLQLYTQHERLLEDLGHREGRGHTVCPLPHIQDIHQRRAQLRYPRLESNVLITDLGTTAEEFRPPPQSLRLGDLNSLGPSVLLNTATTIPGPSTAPPPPALTFVQGPITTPGPVQPTSTKPYHFYLKASERVVGESCVVCREPFEDGNDPIVELPCWHLLHRECWELVQGRKCPFRCNDVRRR